MTTPWLVPFKKRRHKEKSNHNAEENAHEFELYLFLLSVPKYSSDSLVLEFEERRETLDFICCYQLTLMRS